MAVFVVEDDAQNGPDHVDAHRTVALVAGPYAKRGAVVSSMYSTCGMLRTMELILGLEPMSQFDAAARPMYDCFVAQPDLAALHLSRSHLAPRRAQQGDRVGRASARRSFDLVARGRRRRHRPQRGHLALDQGPRLPDAACPAAPPSSASSMTNREAPPLGVPAARRPAAGGSPAASGLRRSTARRARRPRSWRRRWGAS